MKTENMHSSIRECLQCHLKKFFDMHNESEPSSGLYDRIMEEVERELITMTMGYSGNVQAKASKILGINRNTLRKKIQDLGIIYNGEIE
ncbi:MAG: hypothetical protein KA998_04275 [Rickettsiaceae bacterium]|nr:hypothetical protein [Rickettsiaceae bacterium]